MPQARNVSAQVQQMAERSALLPVGRQSARCTAIMSSPLLPLVCRAPNGLDLALITYLLTQNGFVLLFRFSDAARMSQSLREGKNDAQAEFTAFSACSDRRVGRNADADTLDLNVYDPTLPATTDLGKLVRQVNDADPDQMTVAFLTYHLIDLLTRAQQNHGLPEFDLVICDEAHHRTSRQANQFNHSRGCP